MVQGNTIIIIKEEYDEIIEEEEHDEDEHDEEHDESCYVSKNSKHY